MSDLMQHLGGTFPVPAKEWLDEQLGVRNFWPQGFGEEAKGEPLAAGGRGHGALCFDCGVKTTQTSEDAFWSYANPTEPTKGKFLVWTSLFALAVPLTSSLTNAETCESIL